MSNRTPDHKGADGILAAAMKRALPALLAFSPAAGIAGGSSVSSGVRQGGRRVERQTTANVYRLDAAPIAAADTFLAFGVSPAAGEAIAPAVPANDAVSDAELRRFLAENGLLAPSAQQGQSQISGHKRSRQASSASFDAIVASGFAGKPQFSGVCSTLFSLCTSDAGNLCVTTNAPCTGSRPPGVTSIALVGAPAVTATSITYTVTFDETPTAASVSADDFQVTTVSGSATGTVTGVVLIPGPSPLPRVSDNRFTVTISSISGNGSIRLDLKANTNIVDVNPKFSLGTTGPYGNGNAGFTAAFSAGTVHTVALNNAPTGSVTISGTATENQTLTASNTLADSDGLGAISYQWKRGGVAIGGATASTYVLGNADVGATITVTASYTDGLGNAESVTSGATSAVVNVNDAPTGSVTISGTATENQTLTASNTLADADGLGAISYQWRRGGVSIGGATATTYVLGNADVGATITVTASYTDGHGTAEAVTSGATSAVVNVNDAATGGVSISGTATENQTLTALSTLADADGLGALSYQWLRNGAILAGATASTYTLGNVDVGGVMSLSVTYTDLHGTAEGPFTAGPTGAVVNVNDAPTGGVTITGTAQRTQTLTADTSTLADADGLGVLSYQWRADAAPIAGANASTYVVVAGDIGKVITVTVSYVDGHSTSESVTSGATAVVTNFNNPATGSVTIAGTATENQTLTANNTLADVDGLGAFSYQWKRDGVAIGGATATTYVLGNADVGALITVTISYTDGGGNAESATSAATSAVVNVNDVPTGSVTIAGTATENQTLTASNTLADADGLGAISYQWRRGGVAISGATASTYVLGNADVGALITVTASYTDGHGTAEAVTSAATSAVVNVNDVPTGGISISGTATEDQTLTAVSTLADADGLGVLSYQWRRDGVDVPGATASAYLLGDADVGALMSVSVSYTDAHGTAEGPFLGGPTAAVVNINDALTGSVTISGSAVVGQALTASNTLADADGLGALSYQWLRAGVDIVGATGTTYTVANVDIGQALSVRVSYTDAHGTAESAVSASVTGLVGGNRVPTGTVNITGNAVEEQVLSAAQTLADEDGLGPFSYQWRRNGAAIAGATATSYTLNDLDVGAAISVMVSYVDGRGTAESVSSASVGPVLPEGTALPFQKRVFFVNPGNNLNQQSFLRFINRNAQAVDMELLGIDDDGQPATLGAVTFALAANRSLQVTSQDLELGNPGKGLIGRFGAGIGKWQIKVGSSAPVDVMSLIRTPDGFVTNLSDTAPKPAAGEYVVYFANPASNPEQQSFIRVVNRSKQEGTVTVSGIDDNGNPAPAGDLGFTLAPQQAVQFNSNDYELGNPGKGLSGALGDGAGKWRLSLHSPLSLEVMSLIRTPDGFLTSLSATAPHAANDAEADKLVLIANPADETQQQTFIRIVNPSAQAGTVILSAIDDNGQRPSPPSAWFDIGPFQSKQFTASDLETGNPGKGLSGGFGDGVGRWQITITSLLPLEVQNLVRTPDGFVTNLSERAPKSSFLISEVPMLNPGDNTNQRSFLRLINRTNTAGSAIISGVDDAGRPALGGSIVVDIAANSAIELSAQDLELGNADSGQLGAFGKGSGKWRLRIESDVEVDAQALLDTPNGFITNTSAPVR
ncbi:MAG: hypothetical protein Q8L45_11060 [Xanthomonadaceae bacterium]|nr:hypothetical protein [Xanthomonadaceae bacterium]MDP2186351.1 hypothetical protein [Xanthomonadales bacterium]